MAVTPEQQAFIDKIGNLVKVYKYVFGFEIASPTVAQAILESGWGKSVLAAQHNNFFGIKAGRSWKGAVYNGKTKEEYEPGVLTDTTACFRSYPTPEEGIIDYYRVISQPRYEALKGCTDPKTYLEEIIKAGYTTASTYVTDCMGIINKYGLRQFDMTLYEAAQLVIDGRYGDSPDRTAALTLAGFDPKQVQRIVNMIL